MHDDREKESVEESLHIWDESSARLEPKPSAREVESDDDGTDDVDEERKNRTEYPGGEHSGTPESLIDGDVFQVEDIFDESETECNENREEDSFFDSVDGRERTPENWEVLARFFDDPDDEVVEKNEFERPKDNTSDRNSSSSEGIIPESEWENNRMKQGKKQGKKEEDECIFGIYSCCFPDIYEEKSKRKNPDYPSDTKNRKNGREAELKEIISMDKEREDVPRSEREAREHLSHKENRYDREGSCEDTDCETTGIQWRIVHVWKYIPPKEYG